tara:strand:- start:110 stop:1222 length:1113 start_codon:yes stop_codon:yes gene_type:complete
VKAAFRSNIIQADSAVATSSSDQYRFYQNVRFADERYTVRANHLVYYTASGVARLFGDVTLSDGDRRLTADRVSYESISGRLSARGDVSAARGDLKLTADRWYKQATPGVSSAGGSVHYVQVSADTLEVMADSTVVDDRYRFLSSVEVRQGAWSGSADQAIITDGERILMTDQATLRRDLDSTRTVSSSAQSILLTLAETVVSEAVMSDSVLVVFASRADTTSRSTIAADSSHLAFEETTLSALEAYGAAEISVATGGSSSVVGGSTVQVTFSDDHPEHVLINGEGTLHHQAGDGSLTVTITGTGIRVTLTDDALRSVTADSNAVCEIEGEHPTRLSGDRLRLEFEDGKMRLSEVEGKVKGRYWFEDETR